MEENFFTLWKVKHSYAVMLTLVKRDKKDSFDKQPSQQGTFWGFGFFPQLYPKCIFHIQLQVHVSLSFSTSLLQ